MFVWGIAWTLQACGVRPQSFLQWYFKREALSQPRCPPVSRCNQYFLGVSLHYSLKRWACGSNLVETHTYYMRINLISHTKVHPHTKCKRVPVEQLFEQCFPKASVWSVCSTPWLSFPRCSHPSIQSLPGTVPSSIMRLYLFFYTPSRANVQVNRVISLLLPL